MLACGQENDARKQNTYGSNTDGSFTVDDSNSFSSP